MRSLPGPPGPEKAGPNYRLRDDRPKDARADTPREKLGQSKTRQQYGRAAHDQTRCRPDLRRSSRSAEEKHQCEGEVHHPKPTKQDERASGALEPPFVEHSPTGENEAGAKGAACDRHDKCHYLEGQNQRPLLRIVAAR